MTRQRRRRSPLGTLVAIVYYSVWLTWRFTYASYRLGRRVYEVWSDEQHRRRIGEAHANRVR